MAFAYQLRSLLDAASLSDTSYGDIGADWTDSTSAFRILSNRIASDGAKRNNRAYEDWTTANATIANANQRVVYEWTQNTSHRGSFVMRRRLIGAALTQAEALIYINLSGITFSTHNYGATGESSSGAGDGVGGQNNVNTALSTTNGDRYRLTATITGTAGVITAGTLTSNSTVSLALLIERWNGSAWAAHNGFSSGTSSTATLGTANNCRLDYGQVGLVADTIDSNNNLRSIAVYTEEEVTALSLPLNDPDRSNENDTTITLTANPTGGILPLSYLWERETTPGTFVTLGTGNPINATGLTAGTAYNARLTITDSATPTPATLTRSFGFLMLSTEAADARDSVVNFGAKGDSYTNTGNGSAGQTYGLGGTGTGTGWGSYALDIVGNALAKPIGYYPRATDGVGSSGAPSQIAEDAAYFTTNNVTDVVVYIGYNDAEDYAPQDTVDNITDYAEGLLAASGTTVVRVYVQPPAPKWDKEQNTRMVSIGTLLESYCNARTTGAGDIIFLGWQIYRSLSLADEVISSDGTHPDTYEIHGDLIGAAILARGPWYPSETTTSGGGSGSGEPIVTTTETTPLTATPQVIATSDCKLQLRQGRTCRIAITTSALTEAPADDGDYMELESSATLGLPVSFAVGDGATLYAWKTAAQADEAVKLTAMS